MTSSRSKIIMMSVFPEIVAVGAYPVNIMQELPLLADPKLIPAQVRRDSFLA